MRCKFWTALLMLLPIISILGGGCATTHSSRMAFGHYKRLLERQKAGLPLENEAIKELPEMTAGEYEMSGDNYLRQGNLTMAFVQYDKALRLDPTHAGIRYKKGLVFLKKGLPEDAMREFQEILKTKANFALAYEGIGQSFLIMKNIIEAEKNLKKAITLNPGLWKSHNYLGIIYDYQKKYDDAISAYNFAISINKTDNGLLLNNLGMSFYNKEEYENALMAFKKSLKKGYVDEKLYNNLGMSLAKLGKYQEALEAFTKGGDKAKAYNNLGVIYLVEGKYKEAAAAFEKAIELNPSYYTIASDNLKIAKRTLEALHATPEVGIERAR